MPRQAYRRRLTDKRLLQLVDEGAYVVDTNTGEVLSARTGKPIYVDADKHNGHQFLRLYNTPHYRMMPLSHLIWLVATRCPLPRGFEVHHIDTDVTNNAFENLLCIHRNDHRKLHGDSEEVPF